jgi:hypothetical protein
MKKLLTFITVTMLLLSSSLSFAVSSNQQAMSAMLFCHGAYNHLGYTYKANEIMDKIILLTDYVSEQEVKSAENDAIRMVNTVRSKGVTTQEIASMCDGIKK